MKNISISSLAITASILLAGCGHNVIVYGDGIQAEAGFIPDQYKISLVFRYGKILTACVRENTEIEMEGEGTGTTGDDEGTGTAGDDEGQKSANAGSRDKLKIKIGKQISGYYVDAIKAGAPSNVLIETLNENTNE